jgi:SAM-dependent methyltransferase
MSRTYEIAGCPACGATEAVQVADAESMRAEIEDLWAFHTRRLRGDTPPELLHDRVAFSQDPPLRLARCSHCSLLYRNPREREESLVELYGGEDPSEDALEALYENQRAAYEAQASRLTRVAGRPGVGLEVGSYIGAFLGAAAAAGWKFSGVDVNDAANAFARTRGFAVCTGTIEDVEGDGSFDVVAFWNCFDQLPDPLHAAVRARTLLRTGGFITMRVPNGAFYTRWRSRLRSPLAPIARALLAHNNLLGFPYRHGFTVGSLRLLLDRAGFTLEHVTGDALVPLADGWTRAWARAEESAVKTVLRRLPAARAPWLEVYARAR